MTRRAATPALVSAIALTAVLSLLVTACAGPEPTVADPDVTDDAAAAGSTRAEIDVTGLRPLGDDAHYALAAVVDGEAVDVGRLDIDDSDAADGEAQRHELPLPDAFDVDQVTALQLWVASAGGGGESVVLAGDVVDDEAELVPEDPSALGEAAVDAAGTVLLGTPTDADAPETAGLWFLELPPSGPSPSLQLPDLPQGWQWQGWAQVGDEFFDAGRFDAADQPAAAPHNGPDSGPELPGGDFVADPPSGASFPLELHGARLVLGLAPTGIDLDAPLVEVLATSLPDPAADHVSYELEPVGSQPHARVTLSE